MEGKIVILEFVFVGFKFSGYFNDYPTLIPEAAKKVKARKDEIVDSTETFAILYEPQKGKEHKIGFFYVGYIVSGDPVSSSDDAEVITINGKYVSALGTINQMADIYSYIGSWITEKGFKQIWPDTLFVEIYNKPIETEVTGNEEVQVCLPIY